MQMEINDYLNILLGRLRTLKDVDGTQIRMPANSKELGNGMGS